MGPARTSVRAIDARRRLVTAGSNAASGLFWSTSGLAEAVYRPSSYEREAFAVPLPPWKAHGTGPFFSGRRLWSSARDRRG